MDVTDQTVELTEPNLCRTWIFAECMTAKPNVVKLFIRKTLDYINSVKFHVGKLNTVKCQYTSSAYTYVWI